ncbi:BCCT family transporter, partial [Staphylococcus hominis]|uniref:BCCT family transporter n=1 Tax=Staphylococcus hominis TaxID=1290 RepID=UPI001643D968
HPSPLYRSVALPLAYTHFTKNDLPLISPTLPPIFPNKLEPPLPTLLHLLPLFPTIIRLPLSLPLPAIQINRRLNYLFPLPNNKLIQG